MKNIFSYNTCIGKITIAEQDGYITNLFFANDKICNDYTIYESSEIKEAKQQLFEYLEGKRKKFNLKLNPQGTIFMKKVWRLLQDIDYGKIVSYQDIAIKLGNKNYVRAVGMANNKNPIPIFIPCHRVIGKNGKLVGYRGGMDIKEYLINLENSKCNI